MRAAGRNVHSRSSRCRRTALLRFSRCRSAGFCTAGRPTRSYRSTSTSSGACESPAFPRAVGKADLPRVRWGAGGPRNEDGSQGARLINNLQLQRDLMVREHGGCPDRARRMRRLTGPNAVEGGRSLFRASAFAHSRTASGVHHPCRGRTPAGEGVVLDRRDFGVGMYVALLQRRPVVASRALH